MSERMEFTFNTAYTALQGDGTVDDKAFTADALRLRAAFAKIDGFAGVRVWRYGAQLEFEPSAVTRAEYTRQVIKVFDAFVRENDDLFPMRGDKVVSISPPEPLRQSPTYSAAVAEFDTDLYVHINETSDTQVSNLLARELMRLDGARSYNFNQRKVTLQYDPRVVEKDVVLAHLRKIIDWLAEDDDRAVFFPFISRDNPPTISYSTKKTNSVIL